MLVNKVQKILLPVIIFAVFFITTIILNPVKAAPIIEYPEFKAQIRINKDTTFKIKETWKYKFTGETHGLRRDIPLDNPYRERCINDSTLTCGGFEMIIPVSITDKSGNKPSIGKTRIYEYKEENSPTRFLRFEWELYKNGKYLSGEEIEWTIEYDIVGGIGLIGTNRDLADLYFYWNLIPKTQGRIRKTEISVNFPNTVQYSENNLQRITSYPTESNYDFINNTLNLEILDFHGVSEYTLAYKFNKNELLKPSYVEYKVNNPDINTKISFNGYQIYTSQNDAFELFPSSKNTLEFNNFGYIPQATELDLTENSFENLEINLKPNAFMSVAILLSKLQLYVGIILIPIGLFFGYKILKTKGKDEKAIKTVIPQYSPPKNVHPYLLGSLIDEKVDNKDLSGSIIDLAYRGYIKIKEVKKDKDYELIVQNKDRSGLNKIEADLLDILLGKSDSVKISSLKYSTSKFTKLNELKRNIYKEMVNKNYFKVSPQTTRTTYLALGILLFILGIIATIFISLGITNFTSKVFVFTPGIAMVILGIYFFIMFNHMPAKTAEGSKVYNKILGFKMYLTTAERFRLQDLTPETFEKYLSYAVVLGVEKEWANRFKDIYKQNPDWYEGTRPITDAYILSTFARSFSTVSETQIRTLTTSSGSKGSGWSGSSGSFGGFSGGGGGGGSSGGW